MAAAPLSDDDRRRLVEKNLDYVRSLASEIARRLPPEVPLDDLVGYGHKGLIEAAERYDPRRGASFSTFAYYRIRGAVFDGIRKMTWFGRSEAAQVRFEARADDLLEARAAREAFARTERPGEQRPGEPARAAEVADLAEAIDDLSIVFVATLEGFESLGEEQPPPADPGPRRRLQRALAKLPARARKVVRLVYVEGLSIKEAGGRMKISRSWASRIHAQAICLLRAEMDRN